GLALLPESPPDAGRPSAILLSIHTNDETLAWADVLTSASREAGWRLEPAVSRAPSDVHPLGRAARLADGLDRRPDFALLLDVCRAEVGDVLPPAVPALTWLSHQSHIDQTIAARLGPSDRVLATDSLVADRLTQAGVGPDRIMVRPIPCLLGDDDPPPDWADRPIDVAIIADLSPLDPASYGLDLPTLAKVWQAAIDLIRRSIDRFTDADVDAMVSQAESHVAMKIDSPEVRGEFVRTLAGPVAATLIWQDLSQRLSGHEVKLTHRGMGWPADPGAAGLAGVPGLRQRDQLYRLAKCVLFAHPRGVAPPDLLLAANAGAAVAWRAHPRDHQPGGAATLLEPGRESIVFSSHSSLPARLKRLLSSPETWRNQVHQAADRCRRDHSAAAALAAIQAVATSCAAARPS
ncbi:MAG: glycosyltransferase, partial [Planctomycetes bacterium]|nr:glycosyltransferase [Planctomycetota bacterium]